MQPVLMRVTAALVLVVADAAYGQGSALWLDGGRPTPQSRQLLAVLADAPSYGLPAHDYEPRLTPLELEMLTSGRVQPSAQAKIDAAITEAATRFVRDVHSGRIDPRAAGFNLPRDRAPFDAPGASVELATARDVRAFIAAVEPRPRPYRLLKEALARYRELARASDLAAPPTPARSVAEGDEYAGAPQLRRLLAALGDLEAGAAITPSSVIDADLAAAVRRFQLRHGLDPDGVIGTRTYAALAIPLAERVRQLELTLERWRWTTALDRPDIVVNIPQFMLYALPPPGQPGAAVLEMPVIVGQNAPQKRTPIFTAAIERVIFQPYWDIPRGVLVRELLPLIRKDGRYLERNEMEIVGGPWEDPRVVAPTGEAIDALARGELRLRQRPGSKNALGAVKFVLPNPYSVYLHATPAAELFGSSRRAFSHGCIRVSQPAELAEYVLKHAPGEWTREAIEAAMCGSKTQSIRLKTPVRVLIFYSTAAATESQGVLFAEDLYGHDERLARLLLQAGSPNALPE